jgi:DNA adenine methylase
MKNGENNIGVGSRWYPETLARRIAAINATKNKIEFLHKDAFDVIPKYLHDRTAAFFIDPPYTAGGKSAGKRLYLHSLIDHNSLFDLLENAACDVMLTYDDTREVLDLATCAWFLHPADRDEDNSSHSDVRAGNYESPVCRDPC